MTISSFKDSLTGKKPGENISVYLKALWYDATGNWNKAHELVQNKQDKNASWIHAYLHRKEGDFSNADYWYYQAGKERPSVSIEQEWEEIAVSLIDINV